MKRLLLELGGKGACIVCEDADLGKAIAGLVSVWGFHSGQICTAPTRAIVHRGLRQLGRRAAAAAPALKIGPPEHDDTIVGPVISAAHRDRVGSYIQSGADEGAELLVDGRDLSASTGATTSDRRCSPAATTRCASCARRSSDR